MIRDVLTGSGIFHATVFPLKNIRTPMGTNYEAIRHIVRDSIKLDESGAFYETLKWLTYEKWGERGRSRSRSHVRTAMRITPGCRSTRTRNLPAL